MLSAPVEVQPVLGWQVKNIFMVGSRESFKDTVPGVQFFVFFVSKFWRVKPTTMMFVYICMIYMMLYHLISIELI